MFENGTLMILPQCVYTRSWKTICIPTHCIEFKMKLFYICFFIGTNNVPTTINIPYQVLGKNKNELLQLIIFLFR